MLGFIFKIILTRNISSENLGLYSIILSIIMVFATIVSSGIPTSISKLVSSKKINDKYSLVYSGLKIELILIIIITLIALLLKRPFEYFFNDLNSYYFLLSLTPAITGLAIYSPFKGYLWGEKRYFKVSLIEFIEEIIKIITIFILLSLNLNLNSLLPIGFTISISSILSTIIGIIFYLVSGGKIKRTEDNLKEILSSSIPLTTTHFLSSLLQPILNLILPIILVSIGFTKNQALSSIGIALGMTLPILTIPLTLIGSLSMALIPEISNLKNQNKVKELNSQINSSILFTLITSFLSFVIMTSLSKELAYFLFKNYEAGNYLYNSSWTIIPISLCSITTSILNSLNMEKTTFKYFLINAFSNIILIILLPKYFHTLSYFYAIGISSSFVFILNILKIKKLLNLNLTILKRILILILISIPTILLSILIKNLVILVYGNFLTIILIGIISTLLFLTLLVIFNIININIVFKNFNKKRFIK